MKNYFKLFGLVAFFMLCSSFTSNDLNSSGKVIFTKLYINKSSSPSAHESIIIFSDGFISIVREKGSSPHLPIDKKLTKNQFSKFKKLLNRSSFRYLEQSYVCDKSNSSAGNYLFSIELPSLVTKIHVQEGCTMPKVLKELDDFLITEIIQQVE